jgi:NADH:ubiquinone oxidoreductase subunit 6 (subunit J)
MQPQPLIFAVLALGVIGSALFVVTTRNLFHAALMLILSFFCVSGFYVLLEVGFFAVAQVLVYIGAIAILFIFAVMLTRGMMQMPPNNSQSQSAALLCIAVFIAMVAVLGPMSFPFEFPGFAPRIIGDIPWNYTTQAAIGDDYISQFGRELTNPDAFALPFELASVLILLSMVGAIWVARERRPPEIMADRAAMAAEEAEDRAKEEALDVAQRGAGLPETAMAAATGHGAVAEGGR